MGHIGTNNPRGRHDVDRRRATPARCEVATGLCSLTTGGPAEQRVSEPDASAGSRDLTGSRAMGAPGAEKPVQRANGVRSGPLDAAPQARRPPRLLRGLVASSPSSSDPR